MKNTESQKATLDKEEKVKRKLVKNQRRWRTQMSQMPWNTGTKKSTKKKKKVTNTQFTYSNDYILQIERQLKAWSRVNNQQTHL